MTLRQREKTFKQIGATLERAFKQIDEGMAIVDRFDEARDEKEREHFSLLVALSVHNSWQTITKIMRRIAIDVDHDMPKGSGAPNRLIDRMTERTSERPQINSCSRHATSSGPARCRRTLSHHELRNSLRVSARRRSDY